MGIGAAALTVLKAVAERETANGLISVGDLIDATNLEPQVVVNELERLIRGGYVTGEVQRSFTGGDPRPWLVLNPLLSDRGSALVEAETRDRPRLGVDSPGSQTWPEQADRHWDAFISHASEDKAGFVAELARELSNRDLDIWYDDDVLEVGDSVRRAIDEGLRCSDFGIVVISPDFMRKDWPNRELDGILALEQGQKRLLPIWHRVEFRDVNGYSPTVAGRKALPSTIGVPAVADGLCRAMKRGNTADAPVAPTADAKPGPIFLSQVGQIANTRVYGWVVIGTEFETAAAFTDDQIETYTSWLKSLEPRARIRQANSGFIWMTVLGEEGGSSLWAAEVRPGPVVSLLTAIHVRQIGSNVEHAIGFDELVGWWATIIEALPSLVVDLGIERVRLGYGLNPYGLDSTRVVEVDFIAAPQPKRRAEPHQIPPWSAYTPLFDPLNPPADILAAPIRDVLDRFSYGRVEATQAWAADGLADGSLKARYRGPAGLANATSRSSCERCGADLKVRQLVDPPETPGEPSPALECTNQGCRALHDDHGHFLKHHPAILLRQQTDT